MDMTYITNGARRLMRNWVQHRIADEYAMSSDWDNRWRTGGTVDEVMEEAHLSREWLLRGISGRGGAGAAVGPPRGGARGGEKLSVGGGWRVVRRVLSTGALTTCGGATGP